MSIVIDSDITQLINRLNISELKMQECYANKSLEEIVEQEAENGNQEAVEFAYQLFKTPDMLVKIFKLADPENKLAFLKEMNSDKLKEFLPLMEEEDLNEGLKFFDMNKLLEMLEEIPPDQLVKTVFQLFSEQEVIQYLPEEELDKFLESPDLDKNQIMKKLSLIPQEYLAQMYEAISGQDSDKTSSKELLENIGNLNSTQLQDALKVMQPIAKQQLTLSITSSDKKLYEKFDAHAYTNMMKTYKFQPEIVKGMQVIDPDEKIKMLEQLPDDFLSIVITQIDAQDFADQIIKNNPQLLAKAILQ